MKTQAYRAAIVLALTAVSVLTLKAEITQSKSPPIGNAGRTALVQAAGVKGGLVVSVGWEDEAFLRGLYLGQQYVVQGIDTDTDSVAAARDAIKAAELYGPVSAVKFDGKALPYIDDSVNLLVVTDTFADIPVDEVERVLTPGGRVLMKRAPAAALGGLVRVSNPELADWVLLQKSVSPELDEWTHFLHGPDNNAVSKDSRVGPPGRLQWVGGERKTRHHEKMSSLSVCVSAGGRVFYIIDEADRSSILFPPKWKLIACDAFNGKTLWKRDIVEWHSWQTGLKSGPAILPRKLVAVGDHVYVTLKNKGALSLLDASTGETIRTFPKSEGTEEFIVYNDVTYLVRNDGDVRYIEAYTADGKRVWSVETPIIPCSLTASGPGVFYHDGDSLRKLALKDGRPLWTSPPTSTDKGLLTYPYGKSTPRLVVYGNVVLFQKGNSGRRSEDKITAVDASTGKILWTQDHPDSGYQSPEDVLVAGGTVWFGDVTAHGTMGPAKSHSTGAMFGYDPSSGKLVSKFLPDVETFWFHHRCYPAKATEKYLLMSRTGIEFIDFENKTWKIHNWVRGACIYGIMPANGLIYAPPNPCNCFPEAMDPGFNALATLREEDLKNRKWNSREGRLTKGPAYGKVKPVTPRDDWWPMYRHDSKRSGTAGTKVPADIRSVWKTKIGGRITQAVIADGKVFVAGIDNHTIYALDSNSGKILWTFTAGARVDSPPTYHAGMLLFGSADGRAYCLRARDGGLVWNFLAASLDQKHMVYEQLESVWPVHGSVLVRNNEAVFAAGRSMYLDGGLRLFRLNATTGEIISETTLDDLDPNTGKNMQLDHTGNRTLPVALNDILSSDDKHIYMRSQAFDLAGKRTRLDPYEADDQRGAEQHLFSTTGFLDDSWHHRSYWVYGKAWGIGIGGTGKAGTATPSGRILSFDDDTICGFSRQPKYYKPTAPLEYELYGSIGGDRDKAEYRTWAKTLPILVRAMVMSGDTAFIAGPADIMDEEAFRVQKRKYDFDQEKMAKSADLRERQEKLWEGGDGSILMVVNIKDGSIVSEQKLEELPIFDGFAAAEGGLFMSTTDGCVLCFRSKLR